MPYVSLYRKWRPQTFADVIGQDHVVGTLVNAIKAGQVHHAMLFSGTRGTGKTTSARLLAKALNCERGPTPEPCNECESCVGITEGSSLDVVEIDAASHGSVDDARDLREKASYAPASGRFKVYIIDEAHMVTTQGFNALLKILEEPPPHVRFMFATTEPNKVIEAIRSRCQHYEFRRVRTAELAAYFGKICAAEGIDIEPGALDLVARAADGSVRDGLSRLDQILVSVGGEQVREADVVRVLGALPAELRFELGDALAEHNPAKVFELVSRVVDGGHGLADFAREALDHVRDLYVLRVAPDSTALVDTTPDTRARIAAQAQRFAPGELGRLVKLLGELYLDLRSATDQRLVLEVGLARAAMPETSLDADALLARIERLERQLNALAAGGTLGGNRPPTGPPAAAPAPAPPPGAPSPGDAGDQAGGRAATAPGGTSFTATAAASRTAASQPPPAPARPPAQPAAQPAGGGARDGAWAAPAQPAPAGALDLDRVKAAWDQVLDKTRAMSRVTAVYLEPGTPVALEGNRLLLRFPPSARFQSEALAKDDRQRQLEVVLAQVLGTQLTVRTMVGEEDTTSPGWDERQGAAGQSGAGAAAGKGGAGAGAPRQGPPAPSGAGAGTAAGRGRRRDDPGGPAGTRRGAASAAGTGGRREPPGPAESDPDGWAEVPPPSEPDDLDLADGPGEVLGADADTRAVADLALRAFGGRVIEEQPND